MLSDPHRLCLPLCFRQQLDRLRSSHSAELQQLQQACEQQVAWQMQEHEARVLELQQGHSVQLEHVRVAVGISVSVLAL